MDHRPKHLHSVAETLRFAVCASSPPSPSHTARTRRRVRLTKYAAHQGSHAPPGAGMVVTRLRASDGLFVWVFIMVLHVFFGLVKSR